MTISTQQVPLRVDADGVVRVGNTRVTLETLVYAFRDGATPEQIAQDFDALTLADVYASIAYYLQHRDEVDQYVRGREDAAQEVIRKYPELFNQDGLRERLLARQRAKGK